MTGSKFQYYLRLLLISGFLSGTAVMGQNNTLYFMHGVPQAIHSNPALYYNCRTYVELPVLSSLSFAYGNSGFGYHDAIHYGSGSNSDSLIIDMDNLEKKLKKRNYIRNDLSVNLAGAGFLVKEKYYAHFNISLVTESWAGFAGDLVSLKDGNWDVDAGVPRNIDLSGMGFNGSNYLQIAGGISTEISTGLYVGATIKYLKGTANINTRRSRLILETEGDPIAVSAEADFSIRASFPMGVQYDDEGYVSDVNFGNSFSNIIGDFILNKNHGGAIDLGAIWEYNDQLTLSASLVDLGFIRWGSNVHQFKANATVDFIGFDLRDYVESGGNTDFFQAMADSVRNSLHFENSENPYFTGLFPKFYLGAAYTVFPKLQVSALARTEIFDTRPHIALTLGAMYSPLPFVHAKISYSIMNYKLDNVGFGLVLGGKGAQFYVVSDHIPIRWVSDSQTGLIWPYNSRTMNIRFGVNLIFGCDESSSGAKGKYGKKFGPRHKSKYCPAYR